MPVLLIGLILLPAIGRAESSPVLLLPRAPVDAFRSTPVRFGNGVAFVQIDASGTTLWRSDGTAAGTAAVVPLSGVYVVQLTGAGHLLYLQAFDHLPPDEFGPPPSLWVSDGTTGGTRKIADLPGAPWDNVVSVGDRIFFVPTGTALWTSDGTPDGTIRLLDLPADPQPAWYVRDLASRLLLLDSAHGRIWTTDGTARGTGAVADFHRPVSFTLDGDLIYAGVVVDPAHWQLWRSDGTARGTVLLTQHSPAIGDRGFAEEQIVGFGDRVVYTAYDAAGKWALWGFSGRTETSLASTTGGLPCMLVCDELGIDLTPGINGVALFLLDGHPWVTDGTVANTRSFPVDIDRRDFQTIEVAGRLFFQQFVPSTPPGSPDAVELWETDGSTLGTARIGTLPEAVTGTASAGGRLFLDIDSALFALDVPCSDDARTAGERIACRMDEMWGWLSCAGRPAVVGRHERGALTRLGKRIARTPDRHSGALVRQLDVRLARLARRLGRRRAAHRLGGECTTGLGERVERLRGALLASRQGE